MPWSLAFRGRANSTDALRESTAERLRDEVSERAVVRVFVRARVPKCGDRHRVEGYGKPPGGEPQRVEQRGNEFAGCREEMIGVRGRDQGRQKRRNDEAYVAVESRAAERITDEAPAGAAASHDDVRE